MAMVIIAKMAENGSYRWLSKGWPFLSQSCVAWHRTFLRHLNWMGKKSLSSPGSPAMLCYAPAMLGQDRGQEITEV